ncbi:hypothetical protein ACFVVX_15475 [Kitasatospora sp. NPDC058170]|uniref:hypothetical protein n=1 Tax=Kitasatospora sp. NPDC058170 TaxID=3346364 RepID=UPI0036DA05AD
MSKPTTVTSYAQRLRALADQLDSQQRSPSQALLQTLLADKGLLALTSSMAATVRADLDGFEHTHRSDPAAEDLYELGHLVADAVEAIDDALGKSGPHLSAALTLLAQDSSPAEAAASRHAIEQALWTGPAPADGERVYLFWPDSSTHVPVPALATPSAGYVDPYGNALFTRGDAEQIVADLLKDDCGMTAAFEADGTLQFSWPKEYDGEGGQEQVAADARGLYAIGGHWPWNYRRPLASDLSTRALAARVATRPSTAPSATSPDPAHHPVPQAAAGKAR